MRSQRGQSLTEFALVLPILFVILAVSGDLARIFFIQVQDTNAIREGGLFAVQNAQGFTGASAQTDLDTALRKIIAAEEQGTYAPLQCPSWSNPPSSAQVSTTYANSAGGSTIPPAAGSTTTVTIDAKCDVAPFFGLPVVPPLYHVKAHLKVLLVAPH
jgi:Flp pilus assembly protein TadG